MRIVSVIALLTVLLTWSVSPADTHYVNTSNRYDSGFAPLGPANVQGACLPFVGSAQWRIGTDVIVRDDYAYWLMKHYGLQVLNISNLAQPELDHQL